MVCLGRGILNLNKPLLFLAISIRVDCLHMVQLMPLILETQLSVASLKFGYKSSNPVHAYPGCPGKEAVKWV